MAESEEQSSGRKRQVVDAVIIAALSLIAVAPLLAVEATLNDVFALNISPIVQSFAPLLFTLPLPAAYIATRSHDAFQWTSLATLVALPFATIGMLAAALTVGVILGALLVSYKTRSVYHGDNTAWTYFKATGSAVFIIGIAAGIGTAAMFSSSPELRNDIRGNVTDTAIDTAFAHLGEMDMEQAQQDMMSQQASMLSENVSRTSILATERIVFAGVNQSGEFNAQERNILRTGFDTASSEVPSQVSQRTQQAIEEQYGQDTSGTEEDPMRASVRPQVRNVVDSATAQSPAVSLMLFFAAFSIVRLFKIPFSIIGALYAGIFGAVQKAVV